MPDADREKIRAQLGIYLHIYADSFAHRGFTAYKSREINYRPEHSGGKGEGFQGWRLYGHLIVGSIPDEPDYSEEQLRWAMGAAQGIYDRIPWWPGQAPIPWFRLEASLRKAYKPGPHKEDRVSRVKAIVDQLWRTDQVSPDAATVDKKAWAQAVAEVNRVLGYQ